MTIEERPRLVDLLNMNHWKQPVRIAAIASLVTAALSLLLPNQYKSEATLLPAAESKIPGGLGGLAAAAANFGVSLPNGEGSGANLTDILNSRILREQLLQTEFTFKLRTWHLGKEILHQEKLLTFLKAGNLDQGIRKLPARIRIDQDLKTGVISIRAETPSPELSQAIVRKCVALLEDFLQKKLRTRGGDKAQFSLARLRESKEELARCETAFRDFLERNRNYVVSTDPGIRLRGLRLEMDLKLQQQLVSTLAMNLEQALLDEKNDIPVLNVMDQGNLPIEKSRPSRATLVMTAAFLAGVGTWVFAQRRHLSRLLLEGGDRPEATKE